MMIMTSVISTIISRQDDKQRIEAARWIYDSSSRPPELIVETYLRSRGITLPVPPILAVWAVLAPLRRRVPGDGRAGRRYPRRADRHALTFLRADGSGKADFGQSGSSARMPRSRSAAARSAYPRMIPNAS